MNRWIVERVGAWFFPSGEDEPCYGMRWCVTSPNGVDWGDYATWREAMDCADKQAHTITVTLPRIEGKHTVTPYPETDPLMVDTWSGGTVIFTGQSDTEILLTQRELKPLALALLAHHYKQEGARQ